MPIADMLINEISGHRVISFLDGNTGYNQIFMPEEDTSKTIFRCPGFVGLFEWVVMTFGLKNAGATYQRTMNLIFHDLLGIVLEVYIDDIVIKSADLGNHLADLRLALERMCRYDLKMNPLKCAFRVSAGKFLGFIIHEKGIEIDPKQVEATKRVEALTCKKDLQKFLGKVNYLRRFIFNLSGKIDSSPPVLKATRRGVTFKLYVPAEDKIIGAVLTQETEGKEYIITYLSRRLIDTETRCRCLPPSLLRDTHSSRVCR